MLYIIFQYDREPVLIQRILIGFEVILEISSPSSDISLTGNNTLLLLQKNKLITIMKKKFQIEFEASFTKRI